MDTIALKNQLNKLVDSIDDEHLLRTVYDFLKQGKLAPEANIWASLTEAQKAEVFLSYEDSEDS
jgi:hypothetical protein